VLLGGALLAVPLVALGPAAPRADASRGAGTGPPSGAARLTADSATSDVPAWRLAEYRGSAVGPGDPPRAVTVTATTTGAAPPTTAPAPAPTTTTTTAPTPTTTTTTAPPPPPPTTTTAPPASTASATGMATWYAEATPGYCASPFLSFGTFLRVVNVTTGASTTCVVDDREADNPGRVVDLSPSGFEAIAALSQGVVTVSISW
jgi:hypothetical protein